MRTAVFGGTFNPPHLGHIRLARAVIDRQLAGRILFIPAFRPPHKTGMTPAPFADRVAMLRLALRDFPEAEISTMEEGRADRLSYTFDTMRELSAAKPQNHYVLLLGEDSLAQLHLWYRAAELAEAWPIITYPRPGEAVTLAYLRQFWPEHLAEKLVKSRVDLPVFDASSTTIRELLKTGGRPEKMLDDAVLKYIEEKQLYR